MKSTGLLVMLLLLTKAVHSFVPFRSIYLSIPLLVLHKHFLASNADLEEYDNCGIGDKFCYGDIGGCVKRRDCALFTAIYLGFHDIIKITVSHRCMKEDGEKFLAAMLIHCDIEYSNIKPLPSNPNVTSCDYSQPLKNYRVYQMWDGQRCKFNKSVVPTMVNRDLQKKDHLSECRTTDTFTYTIVSVGTHKDLPTDRTTRNEEEAYWFLNLPSYYKHKIITKGKAAFYITEGGDSGDSSDSSNAAAEILVSWITFVLLAISSVQSQF